MSAEALPTPEDVVERTLRPDATPAEDKIREGHPDVEQWEIADRSQAAWALSKIRQAHLAFDRDTIDTRTAIDALRAEADRLAEQVDARAKERDGTIGFFTAKLTGWLRRLRADEPEAKSVKLPGGVVKSRAGRRTVTVDPEKLSALAVFAISMSEDAPLVKIEPRKKAILDYVKANDGELPPGVTVEQGDVTYSVELDGA